MWLFKKELARHFGTSYVFEPMHFASTPPMVTAIANNEVQIGELAYSTLPIAIKNAGLDDIRVIADDLQDGVDGYWTARFAVLKDRPIKKVGAPPASRSFHTRLMVWIASGRAFDSRQLPWEPT